MDKTLDDAQPDAPSPACPDEPAILEEIEVEDLAVDGICGVY
jgi:mycofactocin precursor